MKTDLTEIQNYLKDKNICLLGNASSIMNNKKDIDNYDIVCRINRGLPSGYEPYIGTRTDVLFTATKLRDEMIKQFNAKYVVWTTKCQNLTTPWLIKNAIQNPPEDWESLKSLYTEGKLPSTGIVALQFLVKYINFKTLTLCGFDGFFSGTFYHKKKENGEMFKQDWHDGQFEKEFIYRTFLKHSNIYWVQE